MAVILLQWIHHLLSKFFGLCSVVLYSFQDLGLHCFEELAVLGGLVSAVLLIKLVDGVQCLLSLAQHLKHLCFPVKCFDILRVKSVQNLSQFIKAIGVPLLLHKAQTLVEMATDLEFVALIFLFISFRDQVHKDQQCLGVVVRCLAQHLLRLLLLVDRRA